MVVQVQDALLEVGRFSNWNKLIRCTAWVFRFIQQSRHVALSTEAYLTAPELKHATRYWIRQTQHELFPDEVLRLSQRAPLSSDSRLILFKPYLDQFQLLRLGGRLEFAALTDLEKHPYLLMDCPLVSLLILQKHKDSLHGGVQRTLSELRKEVWLLKGRQVVRKVLKSCLICQRWRTRGRRVEEAPLPQSRVTEAAPFQVTGVDYAGPLWCTLGEMEVKSYLCLFTCAVTRAVHIELVTSQSTEAFLLAFRRFLGRRGKCNLIYSDNAKSYQQADRWLKAAWRHASSTAAQEFSASRRVVWKFIPAKAPWWGGFYERLIGSVKRHLVRSLGRSRLSFEELTTLLVEVEATINSRPLTTVSEDSSEHLILSPAHFLTVEPAASTSYIDEMPPPLKKEEFRKRWRYRKTLLGLFWSRWKTDYLLQLRTAHFVHNPLANEALKIGEVVLIHNDKAPRLQWKIATVQSVTPGRDGKARSALLRCSDGTVLRRAVQHICPLEASND
jgi:hypothetical protein